MRGAYQVRVSRKRGTSFRFTVQRNITIVRGDSGTGKTTLYEMVADYTRLGTQSGVTVQCDRPCVALTDIDWRNQLSRISDSLVFVDEGLEEVASDTFAAAARESSNYYIIFCREELPNLPYSVNEVYRIKTSGKYHSFVQMYKEGDHYQYSQSRVKPKHDFDVLLTEDSKSGLQCWSRTIEATGSPTAPLLRMSPSCPHQSLIMRLAKRRLPSGPRFAAVSARRRPDPHTNRHPQRG